MSSPALPKSAESERRSQQSRNSATPHIKLQTSSVGLRLELITTPLDQVKGLDADTAELLNKLDFSWPNQVDDKSWSLATARLVYQIAPMVLISRKDGFEVLGSGRAWNLAKKLYGPTDSVPALLLSDKKKIPVADKLQFLAAELLGLSAEYRTRPKLPKRLKDVWNQINASAMNPIQGSDAKAFSRATGFSLKSVSEVASVPSKPSQKEASQAS